MSGEGICFVGIDPGAGDDRTVLSCASLACPFCGGSPCPIVMNADYPYGKAAKQDDYGDDGLSVRAVVFCHSCGSEGPSFEGQLFTEDDYISAKLQAVTYWNKRGHHPDLEGWLWVSL